MDINMQVPANVAAIIEAKQAAMAAETKEKEIRIAKEQSAAEANALQMIQDKLCEFEALLPPWILQYEATAEYLNARDERNLLWSIGTGQQHLKTLVFKIPGLSLIEFSFDENQWRSSFATWNDENPETLPHFFFGRDAWWRNSLEYTLIEAQESGKEYQRLLAEREKTLAEQARREDEKRQPKPEPVVEEKQEEQVSQRWTAEVIEERVQDALTHYSEDEIGAAQVRATLLVVEQLKRIADFCERNDGSDGILCQIRDMGI